MKKKLIYLIALSIFGAQVSFAQVSKKIVVEHFTNSNCSVCANRNPGFYTNLNNQSDVLHLAIHPSAPYSSCKLYKDNATDNDARTRFYGIYGSTPRLVVNGEVISASANYSANALFTPYQSVTTPASIQITQEKIGSDSIRAKVVVKTESAHSLGGLSLFVALAEDTVFHTGTNGEKAHYDVFRKSLTSSEGVSVTLPEAVGDSIEFMFTSASNSIWNFDRIYALAILQETDSKKLVQAEASMPSKTNNTSGIADASFALQASVYPNPSSNTINIKLDGGSTSTVKVLSLDGKLIIEKTDSKDEIAIDLSDLPSAIYLLNISNGNGSFMQKILKE